MFGRKFKNKQIPIVFLLHERDFWKICIVLRYLVRFVNLLLENYGSGGLEGGWRAFDGCKERSGSCHMIHVEDKEN